VSRWYLKMQHDLQGTGAVEKSAAGLYHAYLMESIRQWAAGKWQFAEALSSRMFLRPLLATATL
jgi:hypothetical protein